MHGCFCVRAFCVLCCLFVCVCVCAVSVCRETGGLTEAATCARQTFCEQAVWLVWLVVAAYFICVCLCVCVCVCVCVEVSSLNMAQVYGALLAPKEAPWVPPGVPC